MYTYGCKVILWTDHKPLVSISRKPLSQAPKRLQRLLLALHNYDVDIKYKPVLRRYFGTFQKPRIFDVKSTGFLKKPKISTSLFWGFSKTRYFCCRNLGIFTRVKILGYFTRNYRADCDFIRRAKYSWSSIFGRCFMRMSQVC